MDDETRAADRDSQPSSAALLSNSPDRARVFPRWRSWRLRLAVLLVGLVGLAGSVFVWDYAIQKNFKVVVPGKIYRSGQPSSEQLEDWVRQYGLKTIVSLRHSIPAYERQLAQKYRVQLVQSTFSAKTGLPAEQWEGIRRILSDEKNLPVLVHCLSGVDRTGTVIALYRVENQGWPFHKALREMILNYYVPFQYPVLERQLEEHCKGGTPPETAPAPAN